MPSRRADPSLLCKLEEKEALELDNQASVFRFISGFFDGDPARNPFTRGTLLELHNLTIAGIFRCSGKFRDVTSDVRISGASFVPTPAYMLEEAIAQFLHDATVLRNSWPHMDSEQKIEQSVTLFHRFLVIHPFNGGNGRVARALLALSLYDAGVLRPPDEFFGFVARRRPQYLSVLCKADKGNFEPLHEYFTRAITDATLKRLIKELRSLGKRTERPLGLSRSMKLFCRPAYRARLSDQMMIRLSLEFAEHVVQYLQHFHPIQSE